MLLLLTLACGDKDDPLDSATVGTWSDVDTIFGRSCSFDSCHGASAAAGGLSLDGDAHAAVVGVASAQDPSVNLVEPGDSAGSYLVMKLRGADGITADSMPPSGSLDEADIVLIETWIDAGAAP